MTSLKADPNEKNPYPFESIEASIFLFLILYTGLEIFSMNISVSKISFLSFFISLIIEYISVFVSFDNSLIEVFSCEIFIIVLKTSLPLTSK